jgi:hypothetical protein
VAVSSASRPFELARLRWPQWLPRLPLVLASILVLLTALPYLYAYLAQPKGQVFMGFFFLYDDANTYLAKMREGWEGGWLWTNRYTTEPGPGAYFFVFWIVLGHLAAILHVSLMAMYHLARVAGAFFLLLASWSFIKHFVDGERPRRFAIWFLSFGLGMGYVVQVVKMAGHPYVFGQQIETLDWRMPELSAYYSVLALPHFVWAAAFQAVGAVLTLRAAERGSVRLAVAAGLAWLAEASIHAQMPILLGAAIAVALLYRRVSWAGYLAVALAFAIPAPYVAYSFYESLHSPEVLRWSAQWRNNLPPDGFSLFWALAPQLVLAACALPRVLRRRSRNDVFLLAWLLLLVLILWFPNPAGNLRRRFFDGIYLPLVVLGAMGIYETVLPRIASLRRRNLAAFAYVAFSTISIFFLTLAPLIFATEPMYTLSQPKYDALGWLADQPSGVVLSSAGIGLLVPAYTSDTVYVGQYSETYNYADKSKEVYALLTGRGEADLAQWSREHHVRYVFWDDEWGSSPPAGLGTAAYTAPGVRIYRLY